MIILLDVVLVITSLMLVVLVLLHRGKGGGLSSMFGGSFNSSLSGSSVVERNLDRLTIVARVVWTVCLFGLRLLYNNNRLTCPFHYCTRYYCTRHYKERGDPGGRRQCDQGQPYRLWTDG